MKNKNSKRMRSYLSIVIIIFSILILRLAYLQIVKGEDFRGMAEDWFLRTKEELPPRGEILDRNNKKIATNVSSYNIIFSIHGKIKNDQVNNSIVEVVKLIYKYNDKDKINVQNLPINFDEKTGVYSFISKKSTPEAIKKEFNQFKTDNNLDVSLDEKGVVYKLAERYELIGKDASGKETNKYGLSDEMLHKAVALRLAIKSIIYSQYRDIYIANNVKKETFFNIQFKNNDMPGIGCEVAPLRYYPYGEIGSSFIGHLSKISDPALYSSMGYDINRELVGAAGLEKVLENNSDLNVKLRGEPGTKWIKVDKFGKIINESAKLEPIPGDTVVTTIDMNVQKAAEEAFNNVMEMIRNGKLGRNAYPNANRGALVALDVKTGEIIAFVSSPGFDPNDFAINGGLSPDKYMKLYYPDKLYQDKLASIPKNVDDRVKKNIQAPEDGYTDVYDVLPKPMFNYASVGKAPPGSTFKPLTAIAALEEGIINSQTTIEDKGVYRGLPGIAPQCWIWHDSHITHGLVNVAKAIQVSCNYFFYEVGRQLGYKKIGEWAWKFGIGRNPDNYDEKPTTGIEIEESAGTVGSPTKYKANWIKSKMKNMMTSLGNSKYGVSPDLLVENSTAYIAIQDMMMNNNYNEDAIEKAGITTDRAKKYIKTQINNFNEEASRPGNALSTAIGQGDTELTPLQVAQYIATILNGGTRYKAHLVKKVLNPDGSLKEEIQPQVLSKVNLNPKNVEIVKEGMRKVAEEGGTASTVFLNYPVPVGGKTGSAEYGKNSEYVGRSAYGWFVGFAPYDDPQIVVAAVVYDGGHGNYVARAVKAVFDEYFGLNKPAGTTATP